MAQVFGQNVNAVAPAPVLPGYYFPSVDSPQIDGTGLVVPWGGGALRRQLLVTGGVEGVSMEPATSIEQLIAQAALAQTGTTLNYNFEGLVGPSGPPGPPGPQGIGVTNYIGGGVTPSTALTADRPITNGIVFTEAGGGLVTWSTGTLRYQGESYTIAAENTGDTNTIIYWDKGSSNTTFKTTSTLADVLGVDKWIMCYNDEGTAYQALSTQVFHAGVIQASTIDTIHLNALSITTEKINGLAVGTAQLASGAAHIDVSENAAGPVGPSAGSWVNVETATITSGGRIVSISGKFTAQAAFGGSISDVDIRIRNGSETIYESHDAVDVPSDTQATFSAGATDFPGSGNETYYLDAFCSAYSGGGTGFYILVLNLLEHKGK